MTVDERKVNMVFKLKMMNSQKRTRSITELEGRGVLTVFRNAVG